MSDPWPSPPAAEPSARTVRDWMGLSALACSLLGLLSCLPVFSAAGGVLGFVVHRRARALGRRSRLGIASLALTGVALLTQVGLWTMANTWLLPAMERRTVAALTAACRGDWTGAVPAPPSHMLVAPLPTPSEPDTARFGRDLSDALGPVRSISTLNPEIGGALVGPTVSMALVINGERGSATGSARVQWVPSDPQAADAWLPSASVIEIEVDLPDHRTLTLRPSVTPAEAGSP